jgi:Ala-tRNA(Pro) deacylase
MVDLYQFLDELGIGYRRFSHPAVLTCAEVDRLPGPIPGTPAKNIFARDRKARRHFLVVAAPEYAVDLDLLGGLLGTTKLGFASPERLQEYLGITPGAVSLLALVNDTARRVEVVIDDALWQAPEICCHPLVNTETLVVNHAGIEKFLAATGHSPKVLNIPVKSRALGAA